MFAAASQLLSAGILQSGKSPGFVEQGVSVGSAYLTSSGKLAPDAATSLMFFSYVVKDHSRQYLVGLSDGDSKFEGSANNSAPLLVRSDFAPDAGSLIASPTNNPALYDRIHVLLTTEVSGSNIQQKMIVWDTTNGLQTPSPKYAVGATAMEFTSNTDANFRLLNRSGASPSKQFTGDIYRAAIWTGLASVPDISQASVRDQFFIGGAIVDPAISQVAFGTTNLRFDCYGNAAVWNSGNFAYGSFTVTNTFTDI